MIELIVVIAVIAFLSAILFPVFSAAREKARQTTCLSNEKQLGLAMMQYTEDYDELYLCNGSALADGSSGWEMGLGWAGILYPYIKSTATFACPDDSSKQTNIVSYAYNSNLAWVQAQGSVPNSEPAQMNRSTAPVMTVMFYEAFNQAPQYSPATEASFENTTSVGPGSSTSWSNDGNGQTIINNVLGSQNNNAVCETGWMGRVQDTWGDLQGTCGGNGGNVTTRVSKTGVHSAGSNFILADGHVKWMMGNNVSPGYSPLIPTANEATNVNSSCSSNSTRCAAGTAGQFTGIGDYPQATFSAI